MQRNMMLPVLPVVLTGEGKKAVWGTPVLQVSVTALPQTEGVFLF